MRPSDDQGAQSSLTSPGWIELLGKRRVLLAQYDAALERSSQYGVKVQHGKVAEAEFRRWLAEFLPKRYGVTSGYVVSSVLKDRKLLHYDVIIFDQMESPVLWVDTNADHSESGLARAIPAQYVMCVLEVKSSFSKKTVLDACEHLSELQPLMAGRDNVLERYKKYLPDVFSCGLVFFELRKKDSKSIRPLEIIEKYRKLKGFYGGLIIRGEGIGSNLSAKVQMIQSKEPVPQNDLGKAGLLDLFQQTKTLSSDNHWHYGTVMSWTEWNFTQFGFDILALCNGTYDPRWLSSDLGFGANFQKPI